MSKSFKNSMLPASLDAEIAFISAVFADPNGVFQYADAISPDHFSAERHQAIVASIVDLASRGVQPDIIAVQEDLKAKGNASLNTPEAIHTFLDFAAAPENAPHYLKEIRRYWELRTIVKTCASIVERGRQVTGADARAFLEEVEQAFTLLADNRQELGLVPASDLVKQTILTLEELFNNPGGITGVPSGFVDLDKVTAGFQPSDLIILAARPAMGKTSLAMNIATFAAIRAQKFVAVFSLEMSRIQLMQRLLATSAKIQAHRFRDGKMTAEDLHRLYPQAAQFQTDRLLIDDTPAISLFELASRCRKMKREKGSCDLIVVDYLQLMSAGAMAGKGGSREREISIISMGLKALAKELSCPVIALAQLNRMLEQRPDKRPRPADLRESGSIEQDADQILFIYRDEVYNKESPDKGIAEVIIGKNRHGPTETIKLAFQSEFTSFHNLAQTQI